MNVEIVTVGSELNRGDIPDTNSSHIAQRLFSLGYDVRRRVSVPDELPLIVEALQQAAGRSDVMVVTGGLGPTADDLTAEAAALAAGVALEERPEVLEAVEAFFRKLGREMSPNNRRQALVPRGATVIVSPVGTAPCFGVDIGSCRAWFTAGVPREMKFLLEKFLIPDLLERRPPGTHMRSRLLRCFNLPESRLDQLVKGIFAGIPGLDVGFKTEWPENVLLLFCKAATAEEAEANLREAERRALEKIGRYVVAVDNEQTAHRLAQRLYERRETVALVEGCSGGYLAKLLTDHPSGERCVGSALVASPRAMEALLMSASPRDLESTMEEGEGWLCSEEAAQRLAQTARDSVNTTYGVGISPFSGPAEGTARGESGTVWVGLAGPSGVSAREVKIAGDRDQVRRRAAFEAIAWLLAELA